MNDDELAPTQTQGFKVGEKKSINEYAQLDANDESLNRWKASLGIAPAGAPAGPKLVLHSLTLESATAPNGGRISINLENLDAQQTENLKKNPVTIKEGVEYNISISFTVGTEVLSGLKYLHVVKRAGVSVDKLEEMIGSYAPRPEPYAKRFITEEAPTGMLARSGTYTVRSKVLDDDGVVYCDFTWAFKLGKDW